jgi:hypothetical protein
MRETPWPTCCTSTSKFSSTQKYECYFQMMIIFYYYYYLTQAPHHCASTGGGAVVCSVPLPLVPVSVMSCSERTLIRYFDSRPHLSHFIVMGCILYFISCIKLFIFWSQRHSCCCRCCCCSCYSYFKSWKK